MKYLGIGQLCILPLSWEYCSPKPSVEFGAGFPQAPCANFSLLQDSRVVEALWVM